MFDLSILQPITRSCGGCTACCKTHIGDVMKARGGEYCDACQLGSGCVIYEDRPEGCQVYRCLWVCGKGEDPDRPDLLGVVMDMKVVEFQDEDQVALNLWEVVDGAIDSRRVQDIAVANTDVGNIVITRPYKQPPKYYFPKGKFSVDEQHLLLDIIESDPGPLLRQES